MNMRKATIITYIQLYVNIKFFYISYNNFVILFAICLFSLLYTQKFIYLSFKR